MTSFILLSKMFRFLFIPLIIKLNTSVKLLSNLFFIFFLYISQIPNMWMVFTNTWSLHAGNFTFFQNIFDHQTSFSLRICFLCDVNQELVSLFRTSFRNISVLALNLLAEKFSIVSNRKALL